MKNYFSKALLAVATLGLFGCSDKLADEVVQPSLNEDGIGYVAFSISTIGNETRATRADRYSFNQGSADEYDVTREAGANMVFFFDSSENYLGKSDLTVLSDPKDGSDNGHLDETTFSARVNSEIASTVNSCIVLLNADKTAFEDEGLASVENLSGFLKLTDDNLGRYGNYFTMSNSVYVDETKNNKIIDVTSITPANIKPTYEEANRNKVVVHVERLVAKFMAKFTEGVLPADNIIKHNPKTDDSDTQNDGNTILVRTSADFSVGATPSAWGIKVHGWNVNGTETATYFVKNLITSSGDNVFDTNKKIGTNWSSEYDGSTKFGWNDPSRLRSYWAVDPHYNANYNSSDKSGDRYPEQYRKGDEMITGVPETDDKNVLNYITYSNVMSGDGSLNFVNDVTYAPENTFGEYSFITENPAPNGPSDYSYQGKAYRRAATHIIVAAQLLLGDELTNTPAPDQVADKYYYGGAYWVDDATGNNKNNLIKYMVKNVLAEYNTTLYTDADCNTVFNVDESTITDYFTLESAKTEGIKGADGRVALRLNSTLYQKGTGENSQNTAVTQAMLQSLINSVGTAKHYINGKMYYDIPIRHMAPKQDGTPHLYNIGSYGVVRNHWYNVTINSISKPGTPVDDPTIPIIPSDDPEDDASVIAFEIYIIPWHVVDWGVEL